MASESHDAVNFSSDEGRAYARSLLRSRLPHEIHDHILEGICKAVDGIHVLSVLKTGGGKTSYFYGYMHMLQALGGISPTPRFLHRKLPKNPTMVIIFPTKGLEEEMESTFRAYGLSALAINEDTLAAAQRRGDDLWKQACSGRVSMILVSPEQLVSRSFDRLLHTKAFADSLCALGLDEMHLITDWGDTSFRKAFTDIGLVLARMKSTTTLIAVTATLPAADVNRIVHVLGLAPGSYFFTRRSNIRSDIQFITRILRHGLGGWSFPDFDWIVKTKRKTIVYADTVTLAHRLFVYFWSLAPSSHHDRFRMYCAPCASSYNKETRDLFEHDPNLQVVLATDALKVGNNWPNVADAVIINPKNPNDIIQKGGRVGRQPGLVRNPGPRAIVYIPSSMAKRAASIVASPRPSGQKLGGKADDLMTLDMARLLLADCVTDVLNTLYHNPISDPPCSCRTCQSPVLPPSSCVCSGCCPEEPLPKLSRRISPPSSKLSLSIFPDCKRAIAREKLRGFRWGLWERADTPLLQHMSPAAFLPDSRIDTILDNIHRITTASQLLPFVQDLRVLQDHQDSLLTLLREIREQFGLRVEVADTGTKANNIESVNTTLPQSHAVDNSSTSTRVSGQFVGFPQSAYDLFFQNIRRSATTVVETTSDEGDATAEAASPLISNRLAPTHLPRPTPRRAARVPVGPSLVPEVSTTTVVEPLEAPSCARPRPKPRQITKAGSVAKESVLAYPAGSTVALLEVVNQPQPLVSTKRHVSVVDGPALNLRRSKRNKENR